MVVYLTGVASLCLGDLMVRMRLKSDLPSKLCVVCAVLVAERCNGFEALGFKDGVNAVVAEAADVLDAHASLTRDMARAQAIAEEHVQVARLNMKIALEQPEDAGGLPPALRLVARATETNDPRKETP